MKPITSFIVDSAEAVSIPGGALFRVTGQVTHQGIGKDGVLWVHGGREGDEITARGPTLIEVLQVVSIETPDGYVPLPELTDEGAEDAAIFAKFQEWLRKTEQQATLDLDEDSLPEGEDDEDDDWDMDAPLDVELDSPLPPRKPEVDAEPDETAPGLDDSPSTAPASVESD